MTNIVFDIGNVLIAWDEHAAFRDKFADDAEIDRFFEQIGFYDWNLEQDRGRSREDAVTAISTDWPEHAPLMDEFFDRFPDTIRKKIDGTWDILSELASSGYPIFGLTNWGAETWPMAKQVHPELNDVFEGVVVSGHERMIKPDLRIYTILTDRHGLEPSECLFIDDSPKNVEGARKAGWQALLFTGPENLRESLKMMNLDI